MDGLLYIFVFLIITVLLALQVLYSSPSRNSRALFLELKSEESSALIEGISRFEWYRTKVNLNGLKTASNVRTLYAYEFDHEISVSISSWNFQGSKAFCRYLDSDGNTIGEPEERFAFPDYIVNCRKRKGAKTIGISVEKDGHFQPLPLIDRTGTDRKYNLSMCLTPIYGDEPKWLLFIEAIEHYKLQGVEHFYVYIFEASRYDRKVIHDYARTGEIEVHYLLERDQRPVWKWQLVHIADCLLRSRESRWTVFGDLDERFIVENGNTLRGFMEEVRDPKVGGVQFRQQFVLKHHPMEQRYQGAEQIRRILPSRRYHTTTGVASKGYASKCIVDSSKVLRMDIHSVGAFFPAHDFYLIDLPAERGVIRHYRDTSLGNWTQVYLRSMIEKFGALRLTDYPKTLLGELTENVRKRAHFVYANDAGD